MKTCLELHEQYLQGGFKLSERVEEMLARIDSKKQLNAFIQVYAGDARAQAAELDKRRDAGEELGPLAGLFIAVKDNICMQGKRVTCASRILEDFVAPYDATVVRKIKSADGIVIGKTNLDEFAMGSSTENSAHGPARHPLKPDYVAGGSSGGSAIAVAAGMADIALGSDTGGSIRQPAAFCGVVGIKPGYSRVSRYGLVAYASSLDQIGAFGRQVSDVAYMLEVIAGGDPNDATSADVTVPAFTEHLEAGKKLTFGLPAEFYGDGLDPDIRSAIEGLLARLKDAGHTVKDVNLPLTEYAISAYYIIATAEASSNLGRYDGVRYGHRSADSSDLESMYVNTRSEGFGPAVKRRIMLGTYVLSSGYYDAYYRKAQQVRQLIKQEYESALADVDVLITPTTPGTAFRLGERLMDPLKMYLEDIYTVTANLAGIAAISVPLASNADGFPIGVQLMTPALEESGLLQAATLLKRLLIRGEID